MEEVKQILELFDSAEKWNAFIELSNMRKNLINELKHRLQVELKKITDKNLIDSKWSFYFDNNFIAIRPTEAPLIGITIEWNCWNDSRTPWCRRGVCVWVDASKTNSWDIFNSIKANIHLLPMQEYEENIQNHAWLPFIKQIPSKIFNVDDSIVSVEECLYMAKDNAKQLAENLWKEVFKPFANKEVADIICSFILQQ